MHGNELEDRKVEATFRIKIFSTMGTKGLYKKKKSLNISNRVS